MSGHCGQIAQCRSRSAIADLEVSEPLVAEMNAIHRGIGGDYQLHACRHFDYGGVISDVLSRLSPFGEEDANNVELFPRTEIDVAGVARLAGGHRATAGSSARTGGLAGGSPSFHARGRA